MARPRNHYEVLGLMPGASTLEIRNAYRRLAMIMHPDKNPSEPLAVSLFQKLNEAYETLKDDEKRARYDRSLAHEVRDPTYDVFQTSPKPVPSINGQPTAKRGDSIRATFDVEINELRNAPCIKEHRYTRLDRCPGCHGSGHEPAANTKPTLCSSCGGTSIVETRSGTLKMRQACPDCHSGFVFLSGACQTCLGAGRLPKQRKIEVTVPAGLHPGATLRIPRGGHAGPWGGDFGDLMLEVKVDLPEGVSIKGGDLFVTLPIDPISLIVGCEIELPTTGGRILIPPSTRPGERITIKNKGLASTGSSKKQGDLVIQIELEWPITLTSKQLKILNDVRQTMDVRTVTPDSAGARKLLDRLNRRS